MRTDFELWLIVEQNFDKYFKNGICETLLNLIYRNLISVQERDYLISKIDEYGKSRFYYSLYKKANYFWEMGEKKPRKMFIQKQILKSIRDEKRN